MKQYIKEKQGRYRSIYGVPIEIKEKINFNLERVLEQIKKIVPENAFDGIKKIVITDMSKIGEGLPFNAYYINNVIFIDKEQDGTVDVLDDIVHEISHHLEKKYGDLIYGDKALLGAKLNNFTNGLFINEYALTSLREYYGVGFEKYLMEYNNHATIKKQSPVLFEKLQKLIKALNEKEE